jgi:hypothetical protein
MYPRCHTVSILTSTATLDGVGYTPVDNGRVLSVQLASTTLGTTGSIAYTNETTEEAIFSKTVNTSKTIYRPRAACVNSTGGAIKYSTGAAVEDYFYVSDHRVKIAVTNCLGGITGTFRVTIG